MRKILSLSCVLACAGFGCGTGSNGDAYEQAAQEVESAVAALDQADSDDTAIDGAAADGDTATSDDDADSDEATQEANGGHADRDVDSDEATEEANGGHAGKGRKGGGRHGRGHHHGRGHDLLLWYADLDALQVCRDLRETCATSADPAACKDEVHACVQPILDAAFAAMCEERTAMCSADDAPANKCERVAKHCGGDETAPDAG